MELKCDLTVKKEFTINTGNYSSIKPHVSLTINKIPISKTLEVKKKMSIIVDYMFLGEAINCYNDMRAIKSTGIKNVIDNLDQDEMEEDVANAVRELRNIDPEWEV